MLAFLSLSNFYAQVGIGTTTPNASAILDIEATDKGFLPPRMNTPQRDAISSPAAGLMIFNTDVNCIQWYDTKGWYDGCSGATYPFVAFLDCAAGATNNGTLIDGETATGVTTQIAYGGGNGKYYSGQTVTSTGVTGLTATLSAGFLSNGPGSLTYTITGTAASDGAALFAINIAGQTCSLTRTVNPPAGPCAGVTAPAGYGIVASSGKCWLDRNLGATQVATGIDDTDSYGDLYQWGRAADGHEDRNSSTTSTNANTAVPNASNSWDGLFITEINSPEDWLTSQDDTLWQGVSGTNNPCPAGFRLPTDTEWETEILSWSPQDYNGALASPLKLPAAGYRINFDGNELYTTGSQQGGIYWSSTVSGSSAVILNFTGASAIATATAGPSTNYGRANGASVRCVKD